ncbi:MAG TPA: homoserine kinase [Gemmatimonadales bacterium]|nr:homoserine kinase [Gemmatimonadales bacterium]
MPPASSSPLPGRVRVFAPGSVGNIGPGLDVLGLAVAGAGDRVTAAWSDAPGIRLADAGHPELPTDPDRHASALAAAAVLRRAGAAGQAAAGGRGLVLWAGKGLPLAGGQGGSAASAVAGAVAANALLGAPLGRAELLAACLEAEAVVAGRHLDNIAPILLGGAVLVRSMEPIDVVPLPVPAWLHVVLCHPAQRLRTAEGRAALPTSVPLPVALHQAAQVAAIVAAFATGDAALLARAIDDRIAEPARAPLLPGFAEAKAAALAAGALGSSISGSGPTTFALARDAADGERIAAAMQAAYAERGIAASVRVAPVDRAGARLEPLP